MSVHRCASSTRCMGIDSTTARVCHRTACWTVAVRFDAYGGDDAHRGDHRLRNASASFFNRPSPSKASEPLPAAP
jgi:hypothetical protein